MFSKGLSEEHRVEQPVLKSLKIEFMTRLILEFAVVLFVELNKAPMEGSQIVARWFLLANFVHHL